MKSTFGCRENTEWRLLGGGRGVGSDISDLLGEDSANIALQGKKYFQGNFPISTEAYIPLCFPS